MTSRRFLATKAAFLWHGRAYNNTPLRLKYMRAHISNGGAKTRGPWFGSGKGLDLLVLGRNAVLVVNTSKGTNRELDSIAL